MPDQRMRALEPRSSLLHKFPAPGRRRRPRAARLQPALLAAGLLLFCSAAAHAREAPASPEPPDPVAEQVAHLIDPITEKLVAAGRHSIAVAAMGAARAGEAADPIASYLEAAVVERLSADGRLGVIDRSEAWRSWRGESAAAGPPPADGSGAETVLLGTYLDLGDRLRVHARAVCGETGRVLAVTTADVPKPRRAESPPASARLRYQRWWGR